MATESAKFHNNLGTLTMTHCLVEVADEWSWTSGIVSRRRRVRVSGYVNRDDAHQFNLFDTFSNSPGPQQSIGLPGTLTLPWTTISNIKIDTIDLPGETWIEWSPVSIEFTDDDPDSNQYEVDFFGLKLQNPRFNVSLPYRAIRDETVQMPILPGVTINPVNAAYGPIRSRQTHDNMRCVLTGVHMVDQIDVDFITQTLARRGGTSLVAPNGLPAGWPSLFDVASFSSQIAAKLPLVHLWVTGSQFAWQVEKGQANVVVQMECPPQLLS